MICQGNNSKIAIPKLESLIFNWESDEANKTVPWIGGLESWKLEIPSAVAFLAGAFPGNVFHYVNYLKY